MKVAEREILSQSWSEASAFPYRVEVFQQSCCVYVTVRRSSQGLHCGWQGHQVERRTTDAHRSGCTRRHRLLKLRRPLIPATTSGRPSLDARRSTTTSDIRALYLATRAQGEAVCVRLFSYESDRFLEYYLVRSGPAVGGSYLYQLYTCDRGRRQLTTARWSCRRNLRNDGRTAASDRAESTGYVSVPLGQSSTVLPGRPGNPPDQVRRLHPGTVAASSPTIVAP